MEDDDIYPMRSPSSVRRYRPIDVARTDGFDVVVHDQRRRPHSKMQQPTHPRRHPLVFIGSGMLVMLFLWMGCQAVLHWWQIYQDDQQYGRPRTFQTNAVVGHTDTAVHPSHFVVINLSRHVVVVEFPGGDTTKAKIYDGPTLTGDGQELAPVTLRFKDVNGDGKPDLLFQIEGSTLVFLNDSGSFRPSTLQDHIQL